MKFELLNKDKVLYEFKVSFNLLNPIEIIQVYKNDPFIDDIETWLNNRILASRRIHKKEILKSINLVNPIIIDILKINHACSLNDTLWIKEVGEKNINGKELSWKDVNLYNGFKEDLGLVSFFGAINTLNGYIKTPEVTTKGIQGKAWRVIDGKIILYKKGTTGENSLGNEPYSEVIVSEILSFAGIEHIQYELNDWNGVRCSTCDLFTDATIGFISMKEVLSVELSFRSQWNYLNVLEVCKKYKVEKEFKEMLFFDCLILNQDRHFSNFGFTINNDTREIIGFMPLFDHGCSLGNLILNENEIEEKLLGQGTFANTRLMDQGLEFYREEFAIKIIDDILKNLDELHKLDIPEKSIDLAICILKKNINMLMELYQN
ncbi:MAG: hypothetical protein ACRC41_15020 [Sarcina sp.]